MAQRHSEYARVAGDTYVTPKWVYDALYAAEDFSAGVWDCAPIVARDIGLDFLTTNMRPHAHIVTNPPFSLAEAFIRRALELTMPKMCKVAMLLPHAYDTARGRLDLFAEPPFKVKYTLLRRIRWENLEQKPSGPSMNHAWYVWDWTYRGRPKLWWLT